MRRLGWVQREAGTVWPSGSSGVGAGSGGLPRPFVLAPFAAADPLVDLTRCCAITGLLVGDERLPPAYKHLSGLPHRLTAGRDRQRLCRATPNGPRASIIGGRYGANAKSYRPAGRPLGSEPRRR